MLTGASIVSAHVTLNIRLGTWTHAHTMRRTNYNHVIHHERRHRRADIDVIVPVVFGVAQTHEKVYTAIVAKIRIWNTCLGI